MYIDPGSTNVIIQAVIAGVAGAGLAIATFWRRIVNFFQRRKDGKDVQTPAQATPAPSDAAQPAQAPSASDTASNSANTTE